MSLPTTKLAYEDCYAVFEQALESAKGVRVRFGEYQQAHHFRARLHVARSLDRESSRGIYPSDDPMHGRSEFDRLIAKIVEADNGFWVHIEPRPKAGDLEIEEIAAE